MRKKLFKVYRADSLKFIEARNFVAEKMSTIYTGWSNEFDSKFDLNARFFCLFEDNLESKLLATCKIMFIPNDDQNFNFPMECGDLKYYKIHEKNENIGEGGGVAFSNLESGITLLYYVLDWSIKNQIDTIYTTYDKANHFIKRIYLDRFGMEEINNEEVSFSNFINKKTNQPARWQVIIDRASNRRERLDKLLSEKEYIKNVVID